MDANTLVTLIIAGVVAFFFVKDRLAALFRHGAVAPALERITLAPSADNAPLPARAWLDYVNKQPDRVPHVAIIGPSGSGKTTAATAVLAERPGQIVVITAKEGDAWGGLPYVGIDDDASYTTARGVFDALHTEVKRRLVATKRQQLTADWLTIVVDDYSTLVKECPAAADVVKLVARLGRSLRVRLVMLSDSALVKAIGLEGEGETRSNFAFVRLRRGHSGVIDADEQELPIDTAMLRPLAQRAALAGRAWFPPCDPDDELETLLLDRAPRYAMAGGANSAPHSAIAQSIAHSADHSDPHSVEDLALEYFAAGLSQRDVGELIRARGLTIDQNALPRLQRAGLQSWKGKAER